MRAAIVIPARHASTRFPGKPLAMLRGATGIAKPLIQRSWEAASAVANIDAVIIATDSATIAEAARRWGARVAMTPAECANGTERCAAALAELTDEIDVIVNLQGDAPLTPPAAVDALLQAMAASPVPVATPMIRATPEVQRRLVLDQRAGRVGGTTVVTDSIGDAMYFSKSLIPHVPFDRAGDPVLPIFLHLGVYAYRREALARYPHLPPSALEAVEGLEQLRFLHAGIRVRAVEVELDGADVWELNNPSDVAPIEAALAARGIA